MKRVSILKVVMLAINGVSGSSNSDASEVELTKKDDSTDKDYRDIETFYEIGDNREIEEKEVAEDHRDDLADYDKINEYDLNDEAFKQLGTNYNVLDISSNNSDDEDEESKDRWNEKDTDDDKSDEKSNHDEPEPTSITDVVLFNSDFLIRQDETDIN